MEAYQEKLLTLAGFKKNTTEVGWYTINPTGDKYGNREFFDADKEDYPYSLKWHSLDWLETYILPAVREKFSNPKWKERYSFFHYVSGDFWECELDCQYYAYEQGATKVEALNNALRELVK
jgi:hypothetical protein